MTPNRIVLISRGRHEEAMVASAYYPGMLLAKNSSGYTLPHNVIGGGGPVRVGVEDALRGGDITQVIPADYYGPYREAAKGDLLLFRIAIGENIANSDLLMSDGAGALKAYPATIGGAELYQILAASTTITNLGTETTFSNGSYAMPASTLRAGDIVRIRAKAFCIAENSTNTHRVRLYVNSTTLADSTALQLAAGDVVIFDVYMTIRTVGASGTFIASGFTITSVAGTFTTTPFTIASTTLDTTAIATFAIKSLASATSAGNQIRLDEYQILLDRSGLSYQIPLVQAAEAVDNSAGSATAFLRGIVL